MAKRKSVLIELGAKLGPEGEKAFANVQKRLNQVGKVAKKALDLGAYIGVGVGAAGAFFGKLTKDAISAGDALDKMSGRTGLSVEFLSSIQHAADLSGTSIETFEKAVKRAGLTAYDAAQGSKAAQDSFDALGISATDNNGKLKSSEQLFEEISSALAGVENETERAALAQKVFGRSGADLLPMLKTGKEGIHGMMEESRRLGFTWTGPTAKAAAELNDQFTRIQRQVSGVAMEIGVALMPVVKDVTDDVIAWFAANKDLIATDLKDFALGGAEGLRSLYHGLKEMREILEPVVALYRDLANYIAESAVGDWLADRASRKQEAANLQANHDMWATPEATARLERVRAAAQASRGGGEGTDTAAQGAADAARDITIAQKAVDEYRTGYRDQQARSTAGQLARAF